MSVSSLRKENNDNESSTKVIENLINSLVDKTVEEVETKNNVDPSKTDAVLCSKLESLDLNPKEDPPKPTENEQKTSQNSSNPINNNSFYSVKWINFFHQKIPIILQNINGPCPLISICNVLLLRDEMHLSENIEIISNESLMQKLADVLFNVFVPRLQQSASKLNIDFEQNINDALSIFEKLQYGLDVNVKFSGCSDFEYTKEMDIFDLFSINLYHGWLIDPLQTDLYQSLGDKSYNQLVEIGINGSESDADKTALKLLVEDFLKTTATQLTYHGLSVLHSTLKPHELAILFRNNHFSTIYKHPDNNRLYTLVTDSGYLNHAEIIWETLDNLEGAGHFCNFNFKLVDGELKETDNKNQQEKCQNDYLLALSLQRQEEEAQQAEQAQQSQQQRSQNTPRSSPGRSTPRQQSPKKKDKCLVM